MNLGRGEFDVVVVGFGAAGACAAITAAEHGARVLVVDMETEHELIAMSVAKVRLLLQIGSLRPSPQRLHRG